MPESLFNKVADLRPATLLKKRLWHRCFPVNFANFLRTPVFVEHLFVATSERRSDVYIANTVQISKSL